MEFDEVLAENDGPPGWKARRRRDATADDAFISKRDRLADGGDSRKSRTILLCHDAKNGKLPSASRDNGVSIFNRVHRILVNG
ncbi:10364_t:CDS:2 [Paraglomus brasilianum]|uniref:10364_t:CDS:1 n=1 Tax=Paraglomus brasilianum TaxID=144538 RepID=A0A9N9CCM4_9GLOM|nr:10364_t:CDS:2 [Paraglomus brasilianum]